ncbi:hypothetical protein JAAARDRAFT_202495 [Jaapia argillacea MUCL 33604]|uniref:T6SS Phospholipase effector Tle1-like catalytic domain-containing protein n=1 Tax=Jaapia argillacea MUCL 33604 TaxID=933084 RepID=A0A067Q7P2_9AGAM|nr:hypothetical protein JAAARDRAFT_202495 [Jaapia argillacea MUCL 33604]
MTGRTPSTSASRTFSPQISSSHIDDILSDHEALKNLFRRLNLGPEDEEREVGGDAGYDDRDIVPRKHKHRTLVLCFDGTGDSFDNDNSNIVQFFSMLKKHDPEQQMVYYQTGIGTYVGPCISNPIMQFIWKAWDEAVGWSLPDHVMSGYEFLMQNYQANDKICIFGFSRGAYTARALAGMVHKVGLLPRHNHQQIQFAYKMFKREDRLGWKQSGEFKRAFSIDVDIEFLGVWDTVASVGLLPRRLPFTTSNTAVRHFRHAVSLDERRAKFKANLWHRYVRGEDAAATSEDIVPQAGKGGWWWWRKGGREGGDETNGGNDGRERVEDDGAKIRDERVGSERAKESGGGGGRGEPSMPNGASGRKPSLVHAVLNGGQEDLKKRLEEERKFEREEEEMAWKAANKKDSGRKKKAETDVLEVWFAGCHCDVGGGAVPNSTPNSLARIPLRWMIRQCFIAQTGIQFHGECLKWAGLDPITLHPSVRGRPPPIPPSRDNNADTTPTKGEERHKRASTGGTLVNGSDGEQGDGARDEIGEVAKTEEDQDAIDAVCQIYDQLERKWFWWILEWIPLRHRYQNDDDSWTRSFSVNLGRPRQIPLRQAEVVGVNVHRTVKMRMEAEAMEWARGRKRKEKYVPKVDLGGFDVKWVD